LAAAGFSWIFWAVCNSAANLLFLIQWQQSLEVTGMTSDGAKI